MPECSLRKTHRPVCILYTFGGLININTSVRKTHYTFESRKLAEQPQVKIHQHHHHHHHHPHHHHHHQRFYVHLQKTRTADITVKNSHKNSANKNVFKSLLKRVWVCARRIVSGSRFQATGPACENARSPNLDCSLGVT